MTKIVRFLALAGLLATLGGCHLFRGDPIETYIVILNPASVTIAQGSAGNVAVTLAVDTPGLGGPGSYRLDGAPAGVTATFDPDQPSANVVATMTVSVAGTVPVGSYTLEVGTDREVDTPTDLTLQVTAGTP